MPSALFVSIYVQNTFNMKKERIKYEAPTAETLVVRFEGVVCESNGIQQSNAVTASQQGWNDGWDELED